MGRIGAAAVMLVVASDAGTMVDTDWIAAGVTETWANGGIVAVLTRTGVLVAGFAMVIAPQKQSERIITRRNTNRFFIWLLLMIRKVYQWLQKII
jgi:predicted phage tail protein